MWAGCLGYIACHPDSSSNEFRENLLLEYLNFMLQVGFWPRDAHIADDEEVDEVIRSVYRDLLASSLRDALRGSPGKALLVGASERLDRPKTWVRMGEEWFRDYAEGIR